MVSVRSVDVSGPDKGQYHAYHVSSAFQKLTEKEHSDQLFLFRILYGAVAITKAVGEFF